MCACIENLALDHRADHIPSQPSPISPSVVNMRHFLTKTVFRSRPLGQRLGNAHQGSLFSVQQREISAAKRRKKKAKTQGNKDDALKGALRQIQSQYGKGSIMQLGSPGVDLPQVDTISTGSLGLDLALGCGGLPRGRVVELYGPESSGKTSLALHVIAEAQKSGGKCTFIDAEHALDPAYARNLGVSVDDLYVSQPDSGEEALEIADTLIQTGAMDVVVVDSVAALVPQAELDGEMGDSHVALQARLMSQALRKMTGPLAKSETLMIFINQIRSKVGVIFGSPEVTAGGNALKFYASVRLDIRRRKQIKAKDEFGNQNFIGSQTVVKVVKNKMAPPFKEIEFDMIYGEGICKAGELVDLGIRCGVLTQNGAWISFAIDPGQADSIDLVEGPFAQGKEKAKLFLQNPDNVAARKYLEERIYQAIQDEKEFLANGQPLDPSVGDIDDDSEHVGEDPHELDAPAITN